MAKFDMDVQQVVSACKLDERTVLGILNGSLKPHQGTLRKLADGLGVDLDELARNQHRSGELVFDRATNPIVREVLEAHWDEEFAWWPDEDIDELFSRVGVGGALTEDGILEVVKSINKRREYIEKLKLVWETGDADVLRNQLDFLYTRNLQISDAS